ncbi:putative aminoacyltransferase, E1 ubiquitin-activating enzyme [Lupinus albus]|uniref:RBR-type E3 ubiquitin transferase n=1 Tax=Lupinus albus TaxID=3870 RepID=A0A6A4P326_LUPAL|nr:putative aminoacyltransferase, E1 ubiquitin-activating enzyme [Lupinus albus]
MAGTSLPSRLSFLDDYLLVDDFYFSALHDTDDLFPISDEKYAEELQLQEALYSSVISRNRVKNEVKNEVMKMAVKVEADTHLMAPLVKVKEEKVDLFFCTICMDSKPAEEIFRSQNCSHTFCGYCITKYVAAKIQENISMVKCPDPKCRGVLDPQSCRSIIPKDVFDRWEDALCDNLVLGSQKFYCPFKDCSAMLIDDGMKNVTSSECPHCNRMFCAQCKVSWHAGLDCSEFQNLKDGVQKKEDIMVLELAMNNRWRRCSKCKFFVEKNEGCAHISCRLVVLLFQTILL